MWDTQSAWWTSTWGCTTTPSSAGRSTTWWPPSGRNCPGSLVTILGTPSTAPLSQMNATHCPTRPLQVPPRNSSSKYAPSLSIYAFKHLRTLSPLYEVWQKSNETDFLFTKVFIFSNINGIPFKRVPLGIEPPDYKSHGVSVDMFSYIKEGTVRRRL